ncbi:MAG: DUF899 domain-containing protein [Alphaproteobacteria bacterium]
MTRQRDAVAAARRALPKVKIEKDYRFQSEAGTRTLADLFVGYSQLIVQHFMFGEDWNEGCKACSLMAENYDGVITHLKQRDVSLVVISRAPLDRLILFRDWMGWGFDWVSSLGSDFNSDFDVGFTAEQIEGEVYYNYHLTRFPATEAPGMSVFALESDGTVYHTYSCYERGLDPLIGTYHYPDLVPKGRDEDNLS